MSAGSILNPYNKKAQRSIDDQLIPLINIVFLLLIFFLVAGQVEQQSAQAVQPPVLDQESLSQRLDKHFLVTSAGDIFYGGEQIRLQQLDSFVEKQATNLDEIIVKADRNITAEKLSPLLRALNTTSSQKIRFVTVSEE